MRSLSLSPSGSGQLLDVVICTEPWVSGTCAAAYFGPVSFELFLPDVDVEDRAEAWGRAEIELRASVCDKARAFGANYVVGFEVTLDPFAEAGEPARKGLRLHAIGTAAKLIPLW